MPLFVTVAPGVEVSNNTVIDAALLNLLAQPSVSVIGSVDGGSLALGASSVVANSIAANAVNTVAIADGAVTAAKLGALAVTTAKIDALAVTTAKLDVNAVTNTSTTFDSNSTVFFDTVLQSGVVYSYDFLPAANATVAADPVNRRKTNSRIG